ncbi:hypothetical protein SLEP1_g42037 [Rubroshorea leprosula]|uniref:Uncharacterized protein n=1 Tax=Rubroshorea leprosula TaxID=152421 RepID=A0AAV5L9E4_9ROSI|nr:hypothetical protein SLEP1_g42037 [Rubroshorea leprosula]
MLAREDLNTIRQTHLTPGITVQDNFYLVHKSAAG